MRLAHLADLHLGKRQYQRTTARGLNQREVDVAQTFRRHVDAIIALAPDLVVVAGDCFDSVRPSNATLEFALQQFARLTTHVRHVVVVAGNHDTPRTVGLGSPVRLLRTVGVLVADAAPERFECGACNVFAVPDNRAAYPELLPVRGSGAEYGVLVLHAGVRETLPFESDAPLLDADDLFPEAWDYIALGDYHQQLQIHPNAWYSGSIDYTSSNPWRELAMPKGFRLIDLETEEQIFVPIEPARRYIELAPIDAAGMSAVDLNLMIKERVSFADIDRAVVRLIVMNCDRVVSRSLNQDDVRQYEKRALHFHLDRRAPARAAAAGCLAPGQRPSLLQKITEYVDRIKATDVDKGDLQTLAKHYLEEAGEKAGDIEQLYALTEPRNPPAIGAA